MADTHSSRQARSPRLRSAARGWLGLAAVAAYVLLMNAGASLISHATGYSGDAGRLFSLSMTPGYGAAGAHSVLGDLGSAGRAADGITLGIFDTLFPLVYAVVLSFGLRSIARRLGLSVRMQRMVAAVPFAAAAANWLADICIGILLASYPSTPAPVAIAAGLLTGLKLGILGASILVLAVGGLASLIKGRAAAPDSAALPALAAPQSRLQRLLIACGIAGPALFNAVYLIEGATRSGYNAVQQPVSALSLGAGGWMQSADFIAFGVLIACFAVGLRSVMAPGPARTWAPALQLIAAAGLVLIGIFNQDPAQGFPVGVVAPASPSLHGVIHLGGTFLVFNARVAWCFVMAARFARDPRWRRWSAWSIAVGAGMMLFLGAFGATMSGGPAGIFERLATLTASVLTAALAVRLLAAHRGRAARQIASPALVTPAVATPSH